MCIVAFWLILCWTFTQGLSIFTEKVRRNLSLVFVVDGLGTEHYFFGGGRGHGGGQFPKKKKSRTVKTAEQKSCNRGPWGKKSSKCFLLSLFGFFMLKNSCTSYCLPKKSHAQLKGENKIHVPENFPTPRASPEKDNGASLVLVHMYVTF